MPHCLLTKTKRLIILGKALLPKVRCKLDNIRLGQKKTNTLAYFDPPEDSYQSGGIYDQNCEKPVSHQNQLQLGDKTKSLILYGAPTFIPKANTV
jgi:hypothetical protein